jgi:HlyD family secretion protein
VSTTERIVSAKTENVGNKGRVIESIKLIRKSRKAWWILGLAAILLPVVIGGFIWWQQSQNKADSQQATFTVQRGSADVRIVATGVIRPIRQVKISPKQTGLVKRLYVKQGDFVRKGQVLAQMDDSNLLGQIQASRGAYLQSVDAYEKAKRGNRPQEVASAGFQALRAEKAVGQTRQNANRLRLQIKSLEAQAERDRQLAARQTMLAQNGAISEQDRVNAQTQAQVTATQLEMAKQELRQAETAILQSEAELEAARQQHNLIQSGSRAEDISAALHASMQARGNLQALEQQHADMTIRAPFDGVITQKYAEEGAIVTPTTSAATTSATSSSIVNLASPLEMVAQVSEADIPKIKLGQEVEIVPNALPDKKFMGTVSQIAPEAIITQNVTTFEVHASVEPDPLLLSGMNVSSRFIAGREEDVLMIPTVAIVSRRGNTGVLMSNEKKPNDEPEFRRVQIGPTVGNRTVIREGLKEGEVILMGLTKAQLEKQGYGAGRGGWGGRGGGAGGVGGMMRGMGGGGRGGR